MPRPLYDQKQEEEKATPKDKLVRSVIALTTGVAAGGLGLILRNAEFAQDAVHAISGIEPETVKSIGSALGTYGIIAVPTGAVLSYYYAVRNIFD